ncbi:MAG: cobalamin-binding protein [Burkholderiaceae bacterium]|jgi:iron complex transport system substrate-binding protein|nr:cobalamin-binding protein [Burkholderiaceae bacterium]
MKKTRNPLLLFLLCLLVIPVQAVSVVDDNGRTVTLPGPARRIISAAPHITELLYESGGEGHIAGVTSYSDYPESAKTLPLVGDNRRLDMERVLSLKPDLLIAWSGGAPVRQIAQLERYGIPVFYSDPKKLEDIPETLIRFGILLGQPETGREKAAAWRKRLAALKKQYENRPVLSVFYQVSERPLYTLNGKHIISEGIQLCGGRNIFSDLAVLAPRVSLEAVLERNPDVILISGSGGSSSGAAFWQRFSIVEAVRKHHIFQVDADRMDRPGPRLLEGISALCGQLEIARKR